MERKSQCLSGRSASYRLHFSAAFRGSADAIVLFHPHLNRLIDCEQPVDVSPVTDAKCWRLAQACRSRGLRIQAVGVYVKLIEPDPAAREKDFQDFARMALSSYSYFNL